MGHHPCVHVPLGHRLCFRGNRGAALIDAHGVAEVYQSCSWNPDASVTSGRGGPEIELPSDDAGRQIAVDDVIDGFDEPLDRVIECRILACGENGFSIHTNRAVGR